MIKYKFQLTRMKKVFLSLLVFILSPIIYHLSPAFGAPHISGKHIPGKPKDYVHKIPDVNKLRAKGLSPKAIKEAIGATGIKKVAVILIQFSSSGDSSGSPTFQNYDNIYTYINNLKNFYTEVSYSQLDLNFVFFPSTYSAYGADYAMSYYGEPEKGDVLIKEAISEAGISKGTGTGQYDVAMVVHAGLGNESTNNSGDIWSALYPFSNTNGFTEGLIVPELEKGTFSPFGVYCHEFGHQLGLPDLYATDGRASPTQVGKWCLMDMGTWANAGANPSHPSIWCKQLLSWVNLTNVNNTTSNIALSSIETSSQGTKIPIPTANNEYFLLEYRYKNAASYDTGLPGSGILIWHIDEGTIEGTTFIQRKNTNEINNYSHRTVDLEEADSTDPSLNEGDSNDPWPGTKLTFTTPQSNAYNGLVSGVSVLNFAGVGNSSMSFSISFQPWISGFVRDSAGQGIISGIPIAVVNTYTVVISTTDTNGQYLVSLASGTYTLIPSTISISGTNYSFYPSSRTINLTNYLDNQDFTATRRMEIVSVSGEVIPENNVFNPVNAEKTTIWYNLSQAGSVKLQIYTLDGLLVKTLVDDYKNAGYYNESWYGKNSNEEIVATGIYLLYFETSGSKQVKKIAIVK